MATITVRTKYIAPAEPTLPALAVQITQLVDSYMVWVGVTEETAETVERAPQSGSLCKDWAYAMPGMSGSVTATTLYRASGSSDVAYSMSQRLARRFNKPVYLSVDVASTLEGTRVMLDAERCIIEMVSSLD